MQTICRIAGHSTIASGWPVNGTWLIITVALIFGCSLYSALTLFHLIRGAWALQIASDTGPKLHGRSTSPLEGS